MNMPRIQLHVLYSTCGIIGSVPNAVHASEQSVFFLNFYSRLEESQCQPPLANSNEHLLKRTHLLSSIHSTSTTRACRECVWPALDTGSSALGREDPTLMQETMRTQITWEAERIQDKRGIRTGLVKGKDLFQRPNLDQTCSCLACVVTSSWSHFQASTDC